MNSKSNRHKKTSVLAGAEVLGNEIKFGEEIVMSDISTAVAKSNVIPFRFEAKEVRTILIGGEPWFVAGDVCEVLELAGRSRNFLRMLDDDEKGAHIVSTLGGSQEMQVINESGLYALTFKSRKPEAKRFKKWVTAEVLPTIRKTGRYEDAHSKMPTLMDELIGMSELNVIKGLIRDKAKAVPTNMQQSFALTMHNRLHTRFNVPRTELIPAGQFEQACNFVASYALEGEYLPREPKSERLNIHFPIQALAGRRQGMLTDRGDGRAWLDVRLEDVGYHHDSLCELIIFELQRAGYVVDAAQWELATYRNKLSGISSFVTGLNRVVEDPHRYAVDSGEAA